MKHLLLLLVWIRFSHSILFCQSLNTAKTRDQIEINPVLRYDWYQTFSYNWGGRASTDILTMKGLSWGINASYKRALTPHFYLKAGIGFYRYTFNKLNNYSNVAGYSTARQIGYPSPLPIYILLASDRYWYNTLSAQFGFEQVYKIKRNIQLITSLNLSNYFTFSQHYHLTYKNLNNFNTFNTRYFGSSVNLQIGIVKNLGRIQIGPFIFIPIYSNWKKDEIFDENQDEQREKWFRGIGLGFTFSKYLNF